jgi:hypothetical protein
MDFGRSGRGIKGNELNSILEIVTTSFMRKSGSSNH